MGFGEALKSRSDSADGTLMLLAGCSHPHRELGNLDLHWSPWAMRLRLLLDAGYRPIAVCAFIAFEAQRNKISRAGQEGLEKRRRSTASAAAHGWAEAPEVSHHGAPETSGDGLATLLMGPWCSWLGAAAHLTNPQGLGKAVLHWRSMGAHGLPASP